VPYLAFTQDDFEQHLPNIPVGGVASTEYSQADAIKAIEANIKK
jgi:ribose transport system substrate-binding protein